MTVYIGLGIGIVGAWLQSTLLADFLSSGVHPDIVLLAVVAWAALRSYRDGAIWAFFGGLALDLFSAAPIGTSVIALMLAALLATTIGRRVRKTQPLLVVVAVPVATLMYYLVTIAIFGLTGSRYELGGLALGVIGPAFLLDTALAPIVVILLAWLSRALTPPPWAPA